MTLDVAAISADVRAGLLEAGVPPEPGATPLLKKKQVTGSGYNPTVTYSDGDDIVIVFSKFSDKRIDGSSILETDTRILMDATGPVPEIGDKIYISDTEQYNIINPKPIRPSGTAVLWELQCRK
ncbi:hypothetical protein FF098_014805 [Parvularcula flava]|uniref:Uncharacterized protein n=1 Tax=Aquisalinus luteolus TaxID=1566827 RepID=A0A8J3ERS5_9PROT|nr:hypothetical protein [Aquisalinus luteolus]NHK29188.1 hypothetical protein [Aquisalinus luteolus]GGI00033.1 hypothetical protein GCM10011355_27370 [Aquisalinus luteolus]